MKEDDKPRHVRPGQVAKADDRKADSQGRGESQGGSEGQEAKAEAKAAAKAEATQKLAEAKAAKEAAQKAAAAEKTEKVAAKEAPSPLGRPRRPGQIRTRRHRLGRRCLGFGELPLARQGPGDLGLRHLRATRASTSRCRRVRP